ncbi:TPA: Ig-like domain-containing protein, partial [Streptococcus suis]
MKIKFTKGLLSALLTLNLVASPFVAAQEGPNSDVNNVSNGDTIQPEPANTSGQTPALPTEGASDLEPATPGSQVQAGAESDQNPLPNTTEASALSGQTSNELQPVISNLQQVTVANTYRISFDYSLAGLAAKSGDTFTISLPAELETANLIPFDVTQNGVVIGRAVPSGDQVVVTFNDAVTGDTNGTGSMAFNVVLKTKPSEGETVTAKVSVGTESILITKTGTGPIPFETLVNKYNQTGSHVTKDFKLNGNWGPWMNTGKDYLSWWHISINGDATKADLSRLLISDSMDGKLVTDFSGFTNGTNAEIDYASLFNGPYLKQSFSLVRNGQVVADSSKINEVIQWTENGFRLDLTKVDSSFKVPSQDQIVLSYMTLIPFGTAEINNIASFTAAEYLTTDSDVAYWLNATGEAIYDAETTTTTQP